MKIKLLLLTLLYCNIALSQNYLNSTSKWYGLQGDVFDNWWKRSTYTINGDTIINDKTYYKLVEDYDLLLFTPGDFYSDDTLQFSEGLSNLHFIREDSAKFYKYESNEDRLIIDFDLEIGDTLAYTFDYEIVIAIDTVEILGLERKVFTTNYGKRIYEGIGTGSGGIIGGIEWMGDEGVGSLFCYSMNNESYAFEDTWSYPYVSMDDCSELTTSITESLQDSKIEVYPNPAKGLINLKNNNKFDKGKVNLFDTNGKLWHSQSLRDEMQIDIANLATGIYFLTIVTDGSFFYEKVIVTN